MDIKRLEAARGLLVDQTPMAFDCGRTCQAACCKSDEEGRGGVFLFPGEEALIGTDWADVTDASGIFGARALMLTCDGQCERAKRPLGCMIFPLTPVVDGKGRVDVRFDHRARPLCPILRDGLRGLRGEFVDAARSALREIARDLEGLAFLRAWQDLEEKYRFEL